MIKKIAQVINEANLVLNEQLHNTPDELRPDAVKSDNENEHNFKEAPIGSSYVGPYDPITKQQILYR